MRALVLAMLLAPAVTAAQVDPLEWTVARDLRAKVEASRTIAAATRERLLTVFDELAKVLQRPGGQRTVRSAHDGDRRPGPRAATGPGVVLSPGPLRLERPPCRLRPGVRAQHVLQPDGARAL